MDAIKAENLRLRLGGAEILKGISLRVEEGRIYGLIGSNGAGKTSFLRILLGLEPAWTGRLELFGSENLASGRRRVGAVMDAIEPDGTLRAAAYLRRICGMTGTAGQEGALLARVGLEREMKKRVSALSLGMKRRLSLACALAGNPKLLALDEPFNGIDQLGREEMRTLFLCLVSEGVTIFMTSHDLSELLKLASVFGLIRQGEIIEQFALEDLRRLHVPKVIAHTPSPVSLRERLQKAHPEIRCLASGPEEVSLLGESAFPSGVPVDDCRIEITSMNEEEILLWKMDKCKS